MGRGGKYSQEEENNYEVTNISYRATIGIQKQKERKYTKYYFYRNPFIKSKTKTADGNASTTNIVASSISNVREKANPKQMRLKAVTIGVGIVEN